MACGKPFMVASLAIVDPGSSRIIDLIVEASKQQAQTASGR